MSLKVMNILHWVTTGKKKKIKEKAAAFGGKTTFEHFYLIGNTK